MRLARVVPLAALAAFTLAGCWPFGDAPSATPAVSASASATASATPVVGYSVSVSPPASPDPERSPTVAAFDPHPALGDMYITTSGVGPLTVGAAIAGNPGEAMLTWDPAFCDAEISGPGDLGRWVAAYPEVPDHGRPFYVDTSGDGVLHRIDVTAPVLATPEGIHIGSPVAALTAAYPGLAMGAAGWDSIHVYWISDADGTVVFETDTYNADGTIGPDHVAFIRVLAAGLDPDWTVSQSDNIAGGCL